MSRRNRSRSSDRSIRASIAANKRWALEPDRRKATAPARKGFFQRFLDQVDRSLPGLPEDERYRRAESLQRAYFQSLALRSAKARRDAKPRRVSRLTDVGGACDE